MLRISLVVLALASCALAAGDCVGCIVEHDPNSPEARSALEVLLNAVQIKDEEVIQILRYATQVVAGDKYYFTYEVYGGMICIGSYVSQPWVSSDPLGVENECT